MGRSILIFMNSNNNHSLLINNKLWLLRKKMAKQRGREKSFHDDFGVKNNR